MNKQQRLQNAFVYLKGKGRFHTQKELGEIMDADKNTISQALKGNDDYLTESFIKRFCDAFPDVSFDWIWNNIGEMIKYTTLAKTTEEDVFYVRLLPIEAQGGSLNDFVVSVKDRECERVISPVRGADFAMTVAGDSMAPEYPAGSQILIKKINERAFVEWGKVYVLDTCNGSIIKKVMPAAQENCVKCLSINPAPEYAPFEVCWNDIYGVYRVLMCMSVK